MNNLEKRITIAIDGFSSTGKSTLAKQLATHLGYIYVDSGAMYRAVTLYAMENKYIGKDFFDSKKLIDNLDKINMDLEFNPDLGFSEMYLNGINVECKIRSIEVSNFVSLVAEISEVRQKLVAQQQNLGRGKGVVMDGRDIGTVVFPDAELKIFMTASPETRAQRRYDELKQKGNDVSFEAVLQNVQQRDYIDTHRNDSPLVMAKDAIEIDNSHLNREQQFTEVLTLVHKICKKI